ncbi:MAG: hypothetical protein ABGZ53_17885 [Fuerstiella sp.]
MFQVFDPAIAAIDQSGLFGPVSFQGYLSEHGLRADTATAISVDSREKLRTELRDNNCMVLRLGRDEGGKHTAFALVKTDDLDDFFLMHENIFTAAHQIFLPDLSWKSLCAFQALGKLTETSLVNLAIASGLLSFALGIDKTEQHFIPATGQTTYSFDFMPHQSCPVVLSHNAGQVEVDALFFARRNGQECLFLVEAKTGAKRQSLAKHKLVYPLLGIRQFLPAGISVVPVYMHCVARDDGYEFRTVECSFESPADQSPPTLCDLTAASSSNLFLPLNSSRG